MRLLLNHIPLILPALQEKTMAVNIPLLCRRILIIALSALGTYYAMTTEKIKLPIDIKYIPKFAGILMVVDCALTIINACCFYQKPEVQTPTPAQNSYISDFYRSNPTVEETVAFLSDPAHKFSYKGISSYMMMLSFESAETFIRALDQIHPLSLEEIKDLYLKVMENGTREMVTNLLNLPYDIFTNRQEPISQEELETWLVFPLPPNLAILQLKLNEC